MEFTFTEYGKSHFQNEMARQYYDQCAARMRAAFVAEVQRRHTGPVVMLQVGQIDQREWNKWKGQP